MFSATHSLFRQASAPHGPDDAVQLRRVILTLVVGGLAAILDSTMIIIALHTLTRSLHTDVGTIQWVTTGYLLTLALAIPLSGWLESRLGGRRAWMSALTLFIVGSVLCACAWNADSLIAFRVLQGLGGGLIFPLMVTLAVRAAGGRPTPKLMATISLPLALGPILGPVLGGVMLSLLSWRWLFFVNVPIVAVGLLLARRFLPAGGAAPQSEREPLDVIGLALLAPGLAGLLLGLSDLSTHASLVRPDVLIPLGAGVGFLAAFIGWALRPHAVRRPVVDVRLLGHRSLGTASATLLTTGAAMFSGLFLLPLYYQEVRHETVLVAGLLLVPQGVGALLARLGVGQMVDRFGARNVTVASFLITAATTVPFALAGPHASLWWMGAVLLLRGIGVGALIIPASSVAFNDVEPATIPHATMNTRIAQQIGASFGTAIVAVVLATALSHGGVGAFHQAFWWSTGIALVAIIPALWLPAQRKAPAPGAPARATTPARASASSPDRAQPGSPVSLPTASAGRSPELEPTLSHR